MKKQHHQIPKARKRAKFKRTIDRTSANVLDFEGTKERAGWG